MMRTGTPRFFALINAVTKRLSVKNQTPTSMPWCSLLMSASSGARQSVDEASQSFSSADAFAWQGQPSAANSRAAARTTRFESYTAAS